jgi:serine/threonine protein phosphatase PrpC
MIVNIAESRCKQTGEKSTNDDHSGGGASGSITQRWPKCSFFGVFDGHGGSSCAQFLRDNLHFLV